MLDYEKLDVYKCAIEHLAASRGDVGALNIAESVGKTSEAERANRDAIARGEAMECGAILDVVRLLEAISPAELAGQRVYWSESSACSARCVADRARDTRTSTP